MRPGKPHISLRKCAGWSEHLLVAWIFYDRTPFGASKLKRRLHRARLRLNLSKCHIVGNHMSRLIATAFQPSHARIKKVLPEGVQHWRFSSWWDGEKIEMPLKVGHHRPASETPLKWRFAGVPIVALHWMLVVVGFVALRPKSTAMVIAGRSVHLTTLFPGQAWTSG